MTIGDRLRNLPLIPLIAIAPVGVSAASAPQQNRSDRVWAAGYAAAIAHVCPAFAVDDVAVARTGGAATRIDPKTGPVLDDTLLSVFKSGADAAERDYQRDPAFCADPTSHAARAKAWVQRYALPAPRKT